MTHAAAGSSREPIAAKVPEVTLLFWVIKLLTTAGGEAFSDYLALHGYTLAGVVEVAIFVVALWLQLRTRRYVAAPYWFLALAIAIFGTGAADFLHLKVGIPYGGTTALWAVVLAAIFWLWYRSEGTLSIHSIVTRHRELFYWAVVFATFALGTALGDFTAQVLHLGYLGSAVLFAVVIMIPAVAWSRFGLNPVLCFWFAYVVTRPLGASFADWFSKPRYLSGLDYGAGPVSVVLLLMIAVLVVYTAVVRYDIQQPTTAGRLPDSSQPARTRGPATRR
ncbi:MAG: COG4705 family protein [Streptosporangiaceae bacterium]